MLIVHVITRLLRAGSEENTIATCLAQARAGHEVILIHGNESSPVQRAACGTKVQLVELRDLVHRISPRMDFRATRSLSALLKKIQPAIVHTHQSKAGIVGRIAARLAHVPVIVHGVHTLPFVGVSAAKSAMYVATERAVARFTNAFINVSEGTRQTCLEYGIGRPEQHFVAHSGMDLSRFKAATKPENWRALLGLTEDEPSPPVLLMLAALETRKRQVQFVEVFERILCRIGNTRLLLVGEGSTRGAIEATIANRGLAANVILLGHRDDPEKLIALADLTVLTSLREGLPRVVIQSLAAGRPVVTTDLPGIRDIIKTGVNGAVTSADNLEVTADTIAELLEDPARLAEMQRGARQTDVSSWTIDAMSAAVSGVYAQLL